MSSKANEVEEFDPWKTSSGLPLDGADVTIANVEFVTDNTMGAGTIVAKVTFTLDENGETAEQKYSVGKGWIVTDRGDGVAAEKGGNKPFNDQTNWGRFVDGFVAAAEGAGLMGDVRAKIDPRKGSSWVGTKGTTVGVERETTNPTTGAVKKSTSFVFGEITEVGGGQVASAPAAKGAAKAAAPAAKKGAVKPKGAALSDEDRAKLVAIAVETIESSGEFDHDAFMAAALADAEIAGSPAMTKAVMDDGEGSVWAEASAQFESE
jgi:hypothetical protein